MRISDWSSDVCSSDLRVPKATLVYWHPDQRDGSPNRVYAWPVPCSAPRPPVVPSSPRPGPSLPPCGCRHRTPWPGTRSPPRSEEHTSELQSLMRISYAVFCLKKKKNKLNYKHNH